MADLNTPLSGPPTRRRWLRLPLSGPQLLVGLLALLLAVFAGWAAIVDDPLGGEPIAIASLHGRDLAATPKSSAAAADPKTGQTPQAKDSSAARTAAELPANGRVVTIIDGSSGKRQEVVIPGSPEQKNAGGDERLLEGTRHGRIPRVAAGGLRPVEAYAHQLAHSAAQAEQANPRIAIVVRGLGVSASGTADALSRLPAAITLAFTPYGANLQSLAAQARARGHEVLLQAAMEPFDYPDNDPGPQTLLTSLSNEQNIDRLHWLMSRFQGYVGLTNYMGARFTASERAMAPVLGDIAKRGLLYLDDGSSPRSVASHVASANNMPFVKADEVLDAVASPNEIDRALSRLEATARKNGVAVGVASALPVSIDRIVHWAKDAATRGIVPVPLTAAALKAKSS